MLKNPSFSPAQPRRAETRLVPSGVLASFRPSTYPTWETSCLGSSGWAGEEGYAFGLSLAAALLDGLFEHPVRVFTPCYLCVYGPLNPNLAKFLFHKYHTDDFAVKAGRHTGVSIDGKSGWAVNQESVSIDLSVESLGKEHGLRSSRSKAVFIPSLDVVSTAERVECFLEAFANAGENWGIAQRVSGALSFAKRHHEIQEVFRFIAFKRHHPFLIIQPE